MGISGRLVPAIFRIPGLAPYCRGEVT